MQKIISIVLSFLLLLSGTQLAFGQHFCEGKVVEEGMMVGQKKMSCVSLEVKDNCIEDLDTKKADCCVDIFHEVQIDSNYSRSHFEMPPVPVYIEPLQYYDFSWHFVVSYSEKILASEYLPPPLEKNIQVFYQTFLI